MIREITEHEIAVKLLEFGLLPGSEVTVLNKASFNGPIFVQVGTTKLILRRSEAASILVN